jgi:hypothetical protein
MGRGYLKKKKAPIDRAQQRSHVSARSLADFVEKNFYAKVASRVARDPTANGASTMSGPPPKPPHLQFIRSGGPL